MRATTLTGLFLAAALAGCGAAPLDYHPASEIPRGPGLFTGAGGELVMRMDAKAAPDSEEYREFQEWRKWKRQQEQR